jgi:hypothetical protein
MTPIISAISGDYMKKKWEHASSSVCGVLSVLISVATLISSSVNNRANMQLA